MQRAGEGQRGTLGQVKPLHATEYAKNVHPRRAVFNIAPWVAQQDTKGSHAGEEGRYLLADLGHHGQLKT